MVSSVALYQANSGGKCLTFAAVIETHRDISGFYQRKKPRLIEAVLFAVVFF